MFVFVNARIPQGRWFLALVARGQMCLAVVLESRHDNDVDRTYITPSPFYVEEIQDTFDHIKSGGIESLASTWIGCNKRPQVINQVYPHNNLQSYNVFYRSLNHRMPTSRLVPHQMWLRHQKRRRSFPF